ncbi:hypothetical protein HFC70_25810 [Agrobacterium sp. a22-2]|uniref:hypothetical protein n=1 Tax=Agrobacterium sp. a22-2 TaxID=2283840 RepID=UPI0014487FC0|nr:hypothetical protein [Agrobacterium sp. a22-2]NKN39771.1 hypothetical protein [Agrobacterium sp. a22-2]
MIQSIVRVAGFASRINRDHGDTGAPGEAPPPPSVVLSALVSFLKSFIETEHIPARDCCRHVRYLASEPEDGQLQQHYLWI